MPKKTNEAEPTPFDKFAALTKQIVSVPRSEILKREAEYKKARRNPPKGGSKTA
jgi:hypothetical protein